MASQKVLHVAGWESCKSLYYFVSAVYSSRTFKFISTHSLTHVFSWLTTGGFYSRCLSVLESLSLLFPTRLRVIQHAFPDRTAYRAWLLEDNGFRSHFTDPLAQQHASSPFVWFGSHNKNEENPPSAESIQSYLGGHDATLDWCRHFMAPCETTTTITANEIQMVNDNHTPNHNYDYDLVVIGGGSGGMAAAKEAAALGAKVACLDFVKPSPAGTTWGLGGTCVNVGCIPKKLFHAGSLLNEAIRQDAPAFGIQVGASSSESKANEITTHVQWPVLRENIQNYIRSLNFKYRVRLREKEVTYLNKLATFQDKHTIQAVDKKGRASTITSSRFLIATGGRPAPLSCPGGELAISSDDVFFMEQSPGKTLCVGASYISLECAGFLAGLGLDVTVAVRSILLRGFDRECADRVGRYMLEHAHVQFKRGVVPDKMEKLDNGQIQVTFSDGSTDSYDTVLAAVGRTADTEKLGVDPLGIRVNPKNGRILGKYEQTDCPNVYAVGDVLDVSNGNRTSFGCVHCNYYFPLTHFLFLEYARINSCRHSSGHQARAAFVWWSQGTHGLCQYLHHGLYPH